MFYSKKTLLFLFFSVLLAFTLTAQSHKIAKGYISNETNDKPLPYVHIQIKGTGIGTISDKNGHFLLKIPSAYFDKRLLVSYIGYESFETEIKSIKKALIVRLKPADYQIGEVIIMPDSTLLTFLEKAFKKIPENYPDYPTRLTGFYREAVKSVNNEYTYFAEAVTKTYKNSYNKKGVQGQVKILKSLVNEFPKIDSLPIRFYGGVFEASDGDIIFNRGSFINPKNFKNYHYALDGITKFNGNDVYIISFDTKNDSLNGSREGRFYLDKASLAYLFIEYQLTPQGLKSLSANISVRRNVLKLEKTINYFKVDDKWHFKHSKSTEHFKKGSNITWVKEDEYLTTKIQTDSVNPTPLNERLEYGDVFSEKAKSYQTEDYWEEYNVLNKDSLLDKQLKLLYDTAQSKKLLTQKVKRKKNSKSRLISILSRLGMSYGVSYVALNAPKGEYSINYNNLFNIAQEFDNDDYIISYSTFISYSLNHRWSICFSSQEAFSKKVLLNSYNFGPSYRFLLAKKGKPISLYISTYASYNKFGRTFSTIDNETNFDFAGKKISANRLQASIGYETFGLKPGISIEYPLKRRLFLRLSGNYYLPLHTKEKLFLKEKAGFFLTRKKAGLPLSDDGIEVAFNGEPTNKSHFSVSNYSFGIGLIMRL